MYAPHDTTTKVTTLMLKKFMLALTLTLAVGTALTAFTAPAEAYNPACASRAEFSKIKPGQSVKTTQQIIGSKGQVSMAGSFMSQRQWHVCGSPYSWVTLTYIQGRLDNKILL